MTRQTGPQRSGCVPWCGLHGVLSWGRYVGGNVEEVGDECFEAEVGTCAVDFGSLCGDSGGKRAGDGHRAAAVPGD